MVLANTIQGGADLGAIAGAAPPLARAEAFVARYGTKAVFFGRFIAILQTYSAFLAGVSRLPYPHFLLFNAAGGIL